MIILFQKSIIGQIYWFKARINSVSGSFLENVTKNPPSQATIVLGAKNETYSIGIIIWTSVPLEFPLSPFKSIIVVINFFLLLVVNISNRCSVMDIPFEICFFSRSTIVLPFPLSRMITSIESSFF